MACSRFGRSAGRAYRLPGEELSQPWQNHQIGRELRQEGWKSKEPWNSSVELNGGVEKKPKKKEWDEKKEDDSSWQWGAWWWGQTAWSQAEPSPSGARGSADSAAPAAEPTASWQAAKREEDEEDFPKREPQEDMEHLRTAAMTPTGFLPQRHIMMALGRPTVVFLFFKSSILIGWYV